MGISANISILCSGCREEGSSHPK